MILNRNHTKAVWTQIVLLGLCWTFGIMSFMLIGEVAKYLYAFLNCLQVNLINIDYFGYKNSNLKSLILKKGSFLFIFYFLLNEEVRKYLRDKKKKKRLKLKQDLNNLTNNVQDLVNINKDDNADDDDEDEDEDEDSDEENTNKNNLSKDSSFANKKNHNNSDHYTEIKYKQNEDFNLNINNNEFYDISSSRDIVSIFRY
jgi:hypothetical protein